jgi:hypothetical protein
LLQPQQALGDVLVKQCITKQALAKYDEAFKHAPNLKELKEARETVATRPFKTTAQA